jgi:hypothetical protein
LLAEVVEHVVDVEDIGHTELVNSFYEVLNIYAVEFKKIKLCEMVNQVDYQQKTLDKVAFRVHLNYLRDQILGDVFILKDIEPILPLLVACLEVREEDTQEDQVLREEVMELLKKLYEMHGYEKAKKDIEYSLVNDQRLYNIFFDSVTFKDIINENLRPKTTNPDFYSAPHVNERDHHEGFKNSDDEDDDFPLSNNYKLIESRPKTSCGLMINTTDDDFNGDRKDINFDLSPSQTDANEKDCK